MSTSPPIKLPHVKNDNHKQTRLDEEREGDQSRSKMLKWLKHRPHQDLQGLPPPPPPPQSLDPFTTTSKHGEKSGKKAKGLSKSSDKHTVSRVNPIFEEEGLATVTPAEGNHSSGYDSSSGSSPSDEEVHPKPGKDVKGSPTLSTASASSSSSTGSGKGRMTKVVLLPKPPNLFQDPSAEPQGPIGRALVNIREQNPDFVQHITVSRSSQPKSNANSNKPLKNRAPLPPNSSSRQIRVPSRENDTLGAAKILSKNSKYVQSIRICPKPPNIGFGVPPPKSKKNVKLGRKPSVTFNERVDVVGTLGGTQEMDSLVTESLLILTSNGVKGGGGPLHPNIHKVFVETHHHPPTTPQDPVKFNSELDLQAFSTSIRKSRPVRQFRVTNPFDPGDLDRIHHQETESDQGNDEESSGSSGQGSPMTLARSKSSGSLGWSPFGGIADAYAAADGASGLELHPPSSKSKKDLLRELGLTKSVQEEDSELEIDSLDRLNVLRTSHTGPPWAEDVKEEPERTKNHQGQDHQHHLMIPIYEEIGHEDSDSGNSTDRSPQGKELQLSLGGLKRTGLGSSSESGLSSKSSSAGGSTVSSSGSQKVMIVSGDSQNLVVDLSAVPPDLREAILNGTALVNLPETRGGLKGSGGPPYTIISIPPESPEESKYGARNKSQIWDVLQQSGKPTKKYNQTVIPYHPNLDSHATPDFTLEGSRLAKQNQKVRVGKKRRCFCRVFGMLFFLFIFVGVLVSLSMIYTRGQKYFGP